MLPVHNNKLSKFAGLGTLYIRSPCMCVHAHTHTLSHVCMHTHKHTQCMPTFSMVRGRLQRNYHVCIRRITRPQAYWPCQHRPQVRWPCQYAPAQHHNRWPARDQGCYGRTSRDTPANRWSRSRHDDAELSSRGKRSNRVVRSPVERTLSPSDPSVRGEFSLSPSSIHAPPRVSCSSGRLS